MTGLHSLDIQVQTSAKQMVFIILSNRQVHDQYYCITNLMEDFFLFPAASAAAERQLEIFFSVMERRNLFTRQALEGVWVNTLLTQELDNLVEDVLGPLGPLRTLPGVLT